MKADELKKMTLQEKDLYFCTMCRGREVEYYGGEKWYVSPVYDKQCQKCRKEWLRVAS